MPLTVPPLTDQSLQAVGNPLRCPPGRGPFVLVILTRSWLEGERGHDWERGWWDYVRRGDPACGTA